jgi:hypothetical protein
MKTYLLREIPDDLWKKAKVKAAQDELPIRSIIVKLLENYIKEEKEYDNKDLSKM